jgi:hypothetical protein
MSASARRLDASGPRSSAIAETTGDPAGGAGLPIQRGPARSTLAAPTAASVLDLVDAARAALELGMVSHGPDHARHLRDAAARLRRAASETIALIALEASP